MRELTPLNSKSKLKQKNSGHVQLDLYDFLKLYSLFEKCVFLHSLRERYGGGERGLKSSFESKKWGKYPPA